MNESWAKVAQNIFYSLKRRYERFTLSLICMNVHWFPSKLQKVLRLERKIQGKISAEEHTDLELYLVAVTCIFHLTTWCLRMRTA